MKTIVHSVLVVLCSLSATLRAGDTKAETRTAPQWVWHDEGDPAAVAPPGEWFFRKPVVFDRLRVVKIDITADDEFVLYLNGMEVGRGDDWHRVRSFDVTSHARVGTNVLAVRARNRDGAAGLLVRGYVGWANGTQWTFHSDASWRSSTVEQPGWNQIQFDDSQWSAVKVLGAAGKAGPWRNLVWESGYSDRFIVPDGFRVDTVASAELTGSLIAMTFDSQGRPTISREHGPAGILEDTDGDGRYDRIIDFGPDVKESQGLYWIGRTLYAAGRGPGRVPDGDGLYRITDDDGDDVADRVELLTKYRGGMGGHGPHAITLGPDGILYHVVGNHAFIIEQERTESPIRQNLLYEGVVLPRYEDPRGHAAGIRVPGGTIWRCDRDGKNWDLIDAGFRNPYDLAFNAAGDLLTYDADMEWDVGLPWYRPTRVLHCVPGGEFGWRSGNAKWPDYYLDSLPALRNVGRGSPTGVMVYQHDHYPTKYRDTLWLGDWTNGLILVEHLRPAGSTYESTPEIFARGEPMNITDLEVGPDGNVYFCTGGWGTEGGVYRITWTGSEKAGNSVVAASRHREPPNDKGPHFLVEQAIHQPQPLSAWGVARVEQLRDAAGEAWGRTVAAIAADPNRNVAERIRAVDILQVHGPRPTEELMLALAADPDARVRARSLPVLAEFRTRCATDAIVSRLDDPDFVVRRRACEALARTGDSTVDPQRVLPLLGHPDRFLRVAARTLLQRIDPASWESVVLDAKDARQAVEGILALQTVAPGRDIDRRLRRIVNVIGATAPTDELFLSAVRVAQVLLLDAMAALPPAATELQALLVARFPIGQLHADWEIARLLARLQAGDATAKIVAELVRPETSRESQIHYAFCLRFMDVGWTPELRRQYVAWFEGKHRWEGGYSFSMYLQGLLADVATRMPIEERRAIVQEWGTTMPTVVAAIIRSFPQTDLAELVPTLIEMDGTLTSGAAVPALQVDDREARENRADAERLADEVTLALGRAADGRAKELLRARFAESTDRRDLLLRALAQAPLEADWPLLVEGLRSADAAVLRATIEALLRLHVKPTDASPYRLLIAAAQRLGDSGGVLAVRLHNQWAGLELSATREQLASAIAAQKEWFSRTFPGETLAAAPTTSTRRHAKFEEIQTYVTQNNRGQNGNIARGRQIFEKSTCVKCHRFEGKGSGIGPDLTTLGKRFKREDILTAVYYPSREINDQYKSVLVELANGVVLTAMLASQNNNETTFLLADGSERKVANTEIAIVKPSTTSIMPDGALDEYELDQIADLLAFLESGEEKVPQTEK